MLFFVTEIHIKMFRKSDALVLDVPKEPSTDIDLSKLYCRITLPAETMGIHAIQFCKPLTEDNSYFCLDIKTLSMQLLILFEVVTCFQIASFLKFINESLWISLKKNNFPSKQSWFNFIC